MTANITRPPVNIEEARKELTQNDFKLVAKACGCSIATVNRVVFEKTYETLLHTRISLAIKYRMAQKEILAAMSEKLEKELCDWCEDQFGQAA